MPRPGSCLLLLTVAAVYRPPALSRPQRLVIADGPDRNDVIPCRRSGADGQRGSPTSSSSVSPMPGPSVRRPGGRAASWPGAGVGAIGDAGVRSRPPRSLAGRRAGHRARRGFHFRRARATRRRPTHRAAAAGHRRRRGRRRSPGRDSVCAAVRGAALRRGVSRADLPAHLLAGIPAREPREHRLRARTRRQRPVPLESGGYRRSSSSSPRTTFFLGRRPSSSWSALTVGDRDARINLLLGGEADAEDNIPPPSNIARLAERPSLRVAQFPSMRSTTCSSTSAIRPTPRRPHPILADPDVRRALALALDRGTMARGRGPVRLRRLLARASAAWYAALAPARAIRYRPGAPAPGQARLA